MRIWNSLETCGALALGAFLAFDANAIIAFDTSTTTAGNINGPWNIGQEFTANQAVTVTELGAFQTGQHGWGSGTVTVAIYDFNTHLIVGSVATFNTANPGSVLSGESAYGANSAYFFQSVTPFQLSAGSTYMIVANYQSSSPLLYTAGSGPTAISANDGSGLLTFSATGNYYTNGLAGLAFPNLPSGGQVGLYGAGSFDFTPVPEATAFGAAAAGLLGLVYVGRYARLRRRMKRA